MTTGRTAPVAGRLRILVVLALSLSTAVWGSSFFLAKQVVVRHDPLTVLALRFAIGAAVMLALRPGCLRGLPRHFWLRGLALGAVYGAAQLPHYYGLREVPAATAGFVVGVYVVVTPALDYLLFRQRSTVRTLAGVALAGAGLAVFAWAGGGSRTGLLLCLVAAVVYALQISVLGAWSPARDVWAFTFLQLVTVAVVTGVGASVKGLDVPTAGADWLVIVYLAVVVGVVGIAVQTWAQHRIPAPHAAVIMAAEPLWAAALAVALTAEAVTSRLVLGGAFLLLANVVIATAPARSPSRTGSMHPPSHQDRHQLEQSEDDDPRTERSARAAVPRPRDPPARLPGAHGDRDDPQRQRSGEQERGQ